MIGYKTRAALVLGLVMLITGSAVAITAVLVRQRVPASLPDYTPEQFVTCQQYGNVVAVTLRDTLAQAWPAKVDTHLYPKEEQEHLPAINNVVRLSVANNRAEWKTLDPGVIICGLRLGKGVRFGRQTTYSTHTLHTKTGAVDLTSDTLYVLVLVYDPRQPQGRGMLGPEWGFF